MDWIEEFIALTDGLRSAPIFRRWAAIATIAGVLQRRVWTETDTGTCYTNLYIMLAGGPGSGKSLPIIKTRELWNTIPDLAIGPDNPTKASLIKRLAQSQRTHANGEAEPMVFSSLAVPCEEFSVLITKYDIEFLAMLSHIWNNPSIYDVPRVSVDSFRINKPNMTILAGVTPDILGSTFPEVAWGQGFTARLIFVYSEELQYDNKNFFRKRTDIATSQLVAPLAEMFDLAGEAMWSPAAMSEFISWLDAGQPPVPGHNRLRFYNSRRKENLPKLAMISAISAGRGLEVSLEDFDRALGWMLEAELYMPDVFRAMAQKSDIQVIAEMHQHISRLWGRREIAKRMGIDDEILWEHLAERVPAQTIQRVLETAERGGWIRRDPTWHGTRPRWIPRPLNEVNTKLG